MNTEILSNLVITKINSVANIFNESNTFGKRNGRRCWAVILKYEGRTEYRVGGKTYVSDKNNPVILPRGSNYEWKCLEGGHFYTIEFESEAVLDGIFSFALNDGGELLNFFKSVEYRHTLRQSETDIKCIRDTYSIILALIKSTKKNYVPISKQEKILPAIKYIAKNYAADITNELLAEQTGMSVVYFRKLFTEVYGISPIAYLHRLRVEKAKEMLKSDHGSITEIAFSLGYKSIYDFSRSFKKIAGVSPKRFQDGLR